jgi:putative Mg2+ transporter-C (MgtC) family protein
MNFEEIVSIDPFSWREVGATLVCGTIIGLERQLRGKPVGIRTSTLIILGTYIFIATSLLVTNAATDPSRIIGQVITGIGFLGAGVMMARKGTIVGVTSAATIWTLAAIGVVIALGHDVVAMKLSLLVVLILTGVDTMEDYSHVVTNEALNQYESMFGRRKTDSTDKADLNEQIEPRVKK